MDLALKAGLSLRDTEDWTPGMITDMIFYKVNAMAAEKAPRRPKQSEFDSF